MPKTVEDLYKSIALAAIKKIPASWKRLDITVEELEKGVLDISAYYYTDENAEGVKFQPGSTASLGFLDLQDMVKRSDTDTWRKAEFHLDKSGKLKIDYEY